MNWKTGIKVLGIFGPSILAIVLYYTYTYLAIVLYPTYTYFIGMDWEKLSYAATVFGTVATVFLVMIGLITYISSTKWNTYRYLADLYYEILKKD